MNREDQRVYAVQVLAFEGTSLNDMADRRSLMAETREVVTGVPLLAGSVTIEEGSVRMSVADAYAQSVGRIVFAPRTMRRFTAVHEIAHIVHHRSHLSGTDHGPEYRGIYVDLITIVYGRRYGDLLHDAFVSTGLAVTKAHLPMTDAPLINIDVLTDATLGSRWL